MPLDITATVTEQTEVPRRFFKVKRLCRTCYNFNGCHKEIAIKKHCYFRNFILKKTFTIQLFNFVLIPVVDC